MVKVYNYLCNYSSNIIKTAKEQGMSIREAVLSETVMTEDEFNEIISPESVSRLGSPVMTEYRDKKIDGGNQ